jgi:PTH2 family peptidyl-tRNA hydrolase
MDTKQVIVMRRDLKMRRGKEIAQGCHASLAFLTRRVESGSKLPKHVQEWMEGSYAKVCVRVDSETELLEIANKAKELGVECHVVTDSGRTEFHGVPTKTCLALGPDYCDKINNITGHLQLY